MRLGAECACNVAPRRCRGMWEGAGGGKFGRSLLNRGRWLMLSQRAQRLGGSLGAGKKKETQGASPLRFRFDDYSSSSTAIPCGAKSIGLVVEIDRQTVYVDILGLKAEPENLSNLVPVALRDTT